MRKRLLFLICALSLAALALITGVATSQVGQTSGFSAQLGLPAVEPTTGPPADLPAPCTSKLVAVGDIDGSGLRTTGKLALAANPNLVVLAGDVAYPDGRTGDFAEVLADPSWTALRPITYAVPGNHEYHTSGAAPFFKVYPGALPRAVDAGCGWRLFLINSERSATNTASQLAWLKQQLVTPGPVILAFHRPVKTSGPHAPSLKMKPFWTALDNRVSIILSGHNHQAERFKRSHNRLQIVTGLGGRKYYAFGTPRSGSAFRMTNRPAIWEAVLSEGGSYTRRFITTTGSKDVGVNAPY